MRHVDTSATTHISSQTEDKDKSWKYFTSGTSDCSQRNGPDPLSVFRLVYISVKCVLIDDEHCVTSDWLIPDKELSRGLGASSCDTVPEGDSSSILNRPRLVLE